MTSEIIAGKYRMLRVLGDGGTGRVYLVDHIDLGAKYALKLLSKQLSEDLGFIERFKREAEILSRFSHPGSLQLRDFGRTLEGRYYMAIEYSDGVLLSDLIAEKQSFSIDEALDIVQQILSVLAAAHELGIVHRDIKPDNIMVERGESGENIVRILDFGIASLKERAELGADAANEGASIGTPEYMSPEQASGEGNLDHRVDIYATGIVLYELLAGQVPFQGDSIVKTLLLQLIQPLDPLPVSKNVPLLVEEIIAKALKKDRDLRFQSAADFREACNRAQRVLRGELRIEELEVMDRSSEFDSEDALAAPGNFDDSKTKILCLDDDPMILNILQHVLEQHDYNVSTISSYTQLHQHVFKDKVSLLLTDVQMPGLSGAKICAMLKKMKPDLKIILFSNIDTRELETLAAESHADAWMSKGLKPKEWLEVIDNLMMTKKK
ncbi:MAG: protein kinase [Bdellovibrionales bacterium]|nr:protein kinase [Bdellovibrionales bacterium]